MPTQELPDVTTQAKKIRIDARLDEALAETFPASDPISVTLEKRSPEGGHSLPPAQIEPKAR